MKKSLLLPYRFKKIGWVLLLPTLCIGLITVLSGYGTSGLAEMIARVIAADRLEPTVGNIARIGNGIEPWLNNVLIIGILCGSLFVACSRERIEDELITHTRLNALLLALYINFAILILAALFVYELDFIDVMCYNLFTLPLLFVALFRGALWRLKKQLRDEE